MAGLHTLWPISELGFQTLIIAHWEEVMSRRLPINGERLRQTEDSMVHSVNISASQSAVWSWLGQVFRGGGIYGWTLLEKKGCRSAPHLIPGLPPPQTGDRVGNVFELAIVRPQQAIVWTTRPALTVLGGQAHSFKLEYSIQQKNATACRLEANIKWNQRPLTAPLQEHICKVIDFVLLKAQLHRLKQYIESGRREKPITAGNSNAFQHAPVELVVRRS